MCIRQRLKETIPQSSTTWFEMGKQTVWAKKVYWGFAVNIYKVAFAVHCIVDHKLENQDTGKETFESSGDNQQQTQPIYSWAANDYLWSESVWSKWAHVFPNFACDQIIVSKHFKTK